MLVRFSEGLGLLFYSHIMLIIIGERSERTSLSKRRIFTCRIVIGHLVYVQYHGRCVAIPVVSLLEVLDLSWEEDVNDLCLYLPQ